MKELRTHYLELVEELAASGMDRAQAEEEAAEKVGKPEDIGAQIRNVHGRASWQSTALTALPFVVALLLVTLGPVRTPGQSPLRLLWPILFCFGALMLAGVVHEFRHDRRPVWVAAWLPAAVIAGWRLINAMGQFLGYSRVSDASLRWILASNILYYLFVMVMSLWLTRKSRRLQMAVIVSQVCLAVVVFATLATSYPVWKAHVQSSQAAQATVAHPSKPVIVSAPVRLVQAARYVPSSPMQPQSLWIWLGLLGALAQTVTWIAVVLAVFALHRRSNVYVAALCLFTLGSLQISLSWRMVNLDFWYMFITWCLPVIGVVLFARASDWRLKISGLAAVIAVPYMRDAFTQRAPDLLVFMTFMIAIYAGRVLLLPLYFERWRRSQKPEIAR